MQETEKGIRIVFGSVLTVGEYYHALRAADTQYHLAELDGLIKGSNSIELESLRKVYEAKKRQVRLSFLKTFLGF